ncbi:MAG: hypothetical protein ACFE88_16765 [Candidatus Hermodarchaeota archaeon]
MIPSLNEVYYLLDYLNLKKSNDFLGESLLPLIIECDKEYKRQSLVRESLSLNGKVSLLINDGFRVSSYRTNN